jgi:hypothetical protein
MPLVAVRGQYQGVVLGDSMGDNDKTHAAQFNG